MEHFYTIQGEGVYTGQAAYFVRLGGCDVGCTWCDVKESWDMNAHPKLSIDEIVSLIKSSGALIAVITGGEPTMHTLGGLTSLIQQAGIRTHIETSGTHILTGHWDWVCFSPKKFKKPLPEINIKANELKIIIYNKHDFEWAEKHAAEMSGNCALILQPEWSKRDEVTPLIIDYVKNNPKWQIGIQTHKYINVP
jgi:organic radical activating enzyme